MTVQALAASGLRSLRYAREVEGIGQVVALDNDKGEYLYFIIQVFAMLNLPEKPLVFLEFERGI